VPTIICGKGNKFGQRNVQYFDQRGNDTIAASAVDLPTQSGWNLSSICQSGQFLSWSIIPEASPVLVDQPSWTHCQTWLFQHRTIALHQALRLHHGPHWGSFTMGCIREANNLPHSLKLNQSGTPSDTIFRVALYLPLILKLEWKRRITVIKMTAWHGSIRTRPPFKLGVNTMPFAFSSTHRYSFCLLS
jgi:hypothetical protein